MIRNCDWDHETLPYIPSSPCLVFYSVPQSEVLRVAVPNGRGEYPCLVPGLPYQELVNVQPTLHFEGSPPPLLRDASTQVAPHDLTVLNLHEWMDAVDPLSDNDSNEDEEYPSS